MDVPIALCSCKHTLHKILLLQPPWRNYKLFKFYVDSYPINSSSMKIFRETFLPNGNIAQVLSKQIIKSILIKIRLTFSYQIQ